MSDQKAHSEGGKPSAAGFTAEHGASQLRHIHVKTAAKEARQWQRTWQQPQDAAQLRRDFPRLSAETHADAPVAALSCAAHFEYRLNAAGRPQPWLHLVANADVPLTCQRCLEAVMMPLAVDHWFRFEQDEHSAALQDDISEEDVLAMDQDLDLLALLEDELLMAIPMIPAHDTCPTNAEVLLKKSVATATETVEEKIHPFAALAQWTGQTASAPSKKNSS